MSSEIYRSERFFLARQPILNRAQSLVAYELLFRRAETGPAGVNDNLSASASVILNTSSIGIDQVIGTALGFINVDAALLMSDVIDFLPASRVVLEILETVKATPELLDRITALRQVGYTFALDDVVSETTDVRAFMPFVSIVKIDITDVSASELRRLCAVFKRADKRLLAEKVETLEQFEIASRWDSAFSRDTISLARPFYKAKNSVRRSRPFSA